MPRAAALLPWLPTILLLLLFLTAPARAWRWDPFTIFLPVYSDAFAPLWHDSCIPELNTPHSASAWCEATLDCVLENSSESVKANMAGASILLGLAPTILGTLAPAVEDLALLGAHRPLLALLLAAGTPALAANNPLGEPNPLAPLHRRRDAVRLGGPARRRHPRALATALNVAEYLLAAACAANVVQLSYDLMLRTVVTWSCPNWGWVIGWSSLPAGLCLLAGLLFRATVRPEPRAEPPGAGRDAKGSPSGAAARLMPPPDLEPDHHAPASAQPSGGGVLGFLWRHEFAPCAQRQPAPVVRVSRAWPVQLLRAAIPLGCFVQYVFGTAILSSLFPVIVRDAFPVLVRYAVSGGVVHAVVAFELRNLAEKGGWECRWEGEGEEDRGEKDGMGGRE